MTITSDLQRFTHGCHVFVSRKRAYRERADYANIKRDIYIFDSRVSTIKQHEWNGRHVFSSRFKNPLKICTYTYIVIVRKWHLA